MFQNLKVDIIYYKTNTDFEMEFNLCGCCRMRLLTDKSPDRKTALHSLARAVSRSRIIIVTGALFGEEGIISLIASAIGSKLETVDSKTYGLSGEEQIEILKGATPLVTPEGYFGGCIIESGPQTMILLSENRNIRKTVMQSLIHPYVEELYAIDLKEKAAATTDNLNIPVPTETLEEIPAEEPVIETVPQEENFASEEPSEEVIIDNEATDELTEDRDSEPEEAETLNIITEQNKEISPAEEEPLSEADAILSSGMIFDSDDNNMTVSSMASEADSELYIDSDPSDFFPISRINLDEQDSEQFLTDDDDIYRTKPHNSLSLNVFIMIVVVFLLIALAILCYCIFYMPARNGVNAADYIRETFNILFGKS